MPTKKTRILVLSSVLPTPSGGGHLLLHRHLKRLPNDHFECLIANPNLSEDAPPLEFRDFEVKRFGWDRITNNKQLRRLANDWVLGGVLVHRREIKKAIATFRPDVILTVAHAELFHVARSLSRQHKIPLITIYHDWWPDKIACTRFGKWRVEDGFLKTARESAAALCVCQGMLDELGNPGNGEILYPIPESADVITPPPAYDDLKQLRVAYSGNLSGYYGQMLLQLADTLESSAQISLTCCGPKQSWISGKYEDVYHGNFSPSQNLEFLRQCDVLLVTMSFESALARCARTSFPSKIVDYCHVSRPIVIWGPSYCSGARWANESGSALVVDSPDPRDLCRVLSDLRRDPTKMKVLSENASLSLNNEFCAERIQQQFENAIRSSISS